MNGIEKITQRIDAVTQGSVDSILSEAKGKAAEIEAKAKADIEKLTTVEPSGYYQVTDP